MIEDQFQSAEELWPLLPLPDQADVAAALRGLAPGIYRARNLYDRYVQLMQAQGREPVSANKFGRELTAYGAHRDRTTMDGRRHASWRITPPPPDTQTDG